MTNLLLSEKGIRFLFKFILIFLYFTTEMTETSLLDYSGQMPFCNILKKQKWIKVIVTTTKAQKMLNENNVKFLSIRRPTPMFRKDILIYLISILDTWR